MSKQHNALVMRTMAQMTLHMLVNGEEKGKQIVRETAARTGLEEADVIMNLEVLAGSTVNRK
jgi:hypothetical protein